LPTFPEHISVMYTNGPAAKNNAKIILNNSKK
jgi:hypothetical protein